MIAMFLLAGCSGGPVEGVFDRFEMVALPPWHADVDFTPKERKAIVEGERWAAKRKGEPSRGVVFDLPHPRNVGEVWPGEIYRGEGCGGQHELMSGERMDLKPRSKIGFAFCAVAHIEGASTFEPIVVAIPDGMYAALAAHEFMHYHGVEHHEGVGLMNPQVPDHLMWSAEDTMMCPKCDPRLEE